MEKELFSTSQEKTNNELQKALTEQSNDLKMKAFKFTDELYTTLDKLPDDLTAQSYEENALKLNSSQGLGDRKTQQDRFVNHKLNGTLQFDDSTLSELIKTTISTIAEHCNKETAFNYSGSTLLACIVRRKIDVTTIISANVGDSRAVCLTLTNENKFNAQRLTCTHKATIAEEAQRVTNNNGQIGMCRTSSGKEIPVVMINKKSYIMLTRKIVCHYVPGITSEPSFTNFTTSKPGFLILCSDGITDQYDESDLEYLFSHLKKQTNPAHHLRHLAYSLQTERNKERAKLHADNMTVTVIAINSEKINETEDILCVIADGHGDKGDLVAEYITSQFLTILNQQIFKMANQSSGIENHFNTETIIQTSEENNQKKSRLKRDYSSMALFSTELTKPVIQQTDTDDKSSKEPDAKRRKIITTETVTSNEINIETNNCNQFTV